MAITQETWRAETAFTDVPEHVLADEFRKVWTPENIEKGTVLNFGGDRQALQYAVEVLGLDKMVADGGPLRVSEVVVSEGGTTDFMGSVIEDLKQLPLIDALDVMQARHWKTQPGYYSIPELSMPQGYVESAIVLAHGVEKDDGVYVDPTRPGLRLNASHYSGAYFVYEENGDSVENVSLPKLIKKHEEGGNKTNIVGGLATFMAANGYRLDMPSATYRLIVGPIIGDRSGLGFSSTIEARKQFNLVHGRFTKPS